MNRCTICGKPQGCVCFWVQALAALSGCCGAVFLFLGLQQVGAVPNVHFASTARLLALMLLPITGASVGFLLIRTMRYHGRAVTQRRVTKMVRDFAPVVGVFTAIFGLWGIGAVIKQHMDWVAEKRASADAPRFERAIRSAIVINRKRVAGDTGLVTGRKEDVDQPMTYPLRSLITCRVTHEEEEGNWLDEDNWKYHYACPKEWLATDAEGVRLVVLISRGEFTKVNDYVNYGAGSHDPVSTFRQCWDIAFVDMASGQVVARRQLIHGDSVSAGTMYRHATDPLEDSEVLEMLKNSVSVGH